MLRCCRRNPSRDRIRFQLDFQDHLRCRGIPAAEVVVTETGDRYVVTDAASLWVLFRFVQGNAYRYGNRAQLENAARCLSDIHGAAADFTAAPVEDDTIPDLRRWWNTLTRDLPLALVDGLPSGWLHADFHGQNIVFAGDRVRGVFDFDVVHRGWRLEDIAYAMFCFCREDRASTVIRADASRAFLEPFGLTGLERKALPRFVVATQARTSSRYRVREREGADPAQVLRTHVARMRALCASLA